MDWDRYARLLDGMGFTMSDPINLRLDGLMDGWPVARYQLAFAGDGTHDHLEVDGVLGPVTAAALDRWGNHLTWNFRAEEFRCRHCGGNNIKRELVYGLQLLRTRSGKPLKVQSGWRCVAWNRAVGGAPNSMHLEGLAADISPALPQKLVRGVRHFGGLGFAGKGKVVRHVDCRQLVPGNRATVADPATWSY